MKIFKYSYLVLLLSLVVACTDDDVTLASPGDAVVDTYFNNEGEFTRAVLGAYNGFKGIGFYSGSGSASDIIIVPDLLADNLILSQDGRTSNSAGHNWEYNAGVTPTDIYSGAYQIIARTNLILENIDKLDDELFPTRELVRSEALALRAIAHFEVARHYVKIPTQSSDANSFIGIAYIDYYDPYGQPSRLASVQETYARIMADLEASLPGLPATVQTGRLSKVAVNAMIGRVALYMGDYPKVISSLTPVVNTVNPAAAADLQNLWRYVNANGVIFEIPMLFGGGTVAGGDPHIGSNYSQGANNTNFVPEYSVDKAFRDLYNDATEPQRVQAYFRVMKNQYVVWKYVQSASGVNPSGRYMRVEESILSLAEAQYLSGNPGAALTTLNKLRNARYSSFTGGETGDDLFNAIQLERRKELAFEGDRWFTIKRLLGVPGIPSQYAQGVVRSGNGYLQDGSGPPSPQQTLPASSYKWQLPISFNTLLYDLNISQTPGY